ncbi:MAG: hypothetical protein RIT81_30030 [Deltaproteobacteria bacterium]
MKATANHLLLPLLATACITGRTVPHRIQPVDVAPDAARQQIAEMDVLVRVITHDWLEEVTGLFGGGKLSFEADRLVIHGELGTSDSYCPFVASAPIRPDGWTIVEWGTGQYVSIPGDEVQVLESCALPVTPTSRVEFGSHEPDGGRRLMNLLATLAAAE